MRAIFRRALSRGELIVNPCEEEAAALLDSYLDAQQGRAEDAVRTAINAHDDGLTGEQTGEQVRVENPETA